jgi:hypothetical protein
MGFPKISETIGIILLLIIVIIIGLILFNKFPDISFLKLPSIFNNGDKKITYEKLQLIIKDIKTQLSQFNVSLLSIFHKVDDFQDRIFNIDISLNYIPTKSLTNKILDLRDMIFQRLIKIEDWRNSAKLIYIQQQEILDYLNLPVDSVQLTKNGLNEPFVSTQCNSIPIDEYYKNNWQSGGINRPNIAQIEKWINMPINNLRNITLNESTVGDSLKRVVFDLDDGRFRNATGEAATDGAAILAGKLSPKSTELPDSFRNRPNTNINKQTDTNTGTDTNKLRCQNNVLTKFNDINYEQLFKSSVQNLIYQHQYCDILDNKINDYKQNCDKILSTQIITSQQQKVNAEYNQFIRDQSKKFNDYIEQRKIIQALIVRKRALISLNNVIDSKNSNNLKITINTLDSDNIININNEIIRSRYTIEVTKRKERDFEIKLLYNIATEDSRKTVEQLQYEIDFIKKKIMNEEEEIKDFLVDIADLEKSSINDLSNINNRKLNGEINRLNNIVKNIRYEIEMEKRQLTLKEKRRIGSKTANIGVYYEKDIGNYIKNLAKHMTDIQQLNKQINTEYDMGLIEIDQLDKMISNIDVGNQNLNNIISGQIKGNVAYGGGNNA